MGVYGLKRRQNGLETKPIHLLAPGSRRISAHGCGGRFIERWRDRSTVLFETVAVYLAFSEAGLEMETLNLAVRDDGRTARDLAGDPVRVAAARTDYAAFEAPLVDWLCR
jgi:hypothetical protein